MAAHTSIFRRFALVGSALGALAGVIAAMPAGHCAGLSLPTDMNFVCISPFAIFMSLLEAISKMHLRTCTIAI